MRSSYVTDFTIQWALSKIGYSSYSIYLRRAVAYPSLFNRHFPSSWFWFYFCLSINRFIINFKTYRFCLFLYPSLRARSGRVDRGHLCTRASCLYCQHLVKLKLTLYFNAEAHNMNSFSHFNAWINKVPVDICIHLIIMIILPQRWQV